MIYIHKYVKDLYMHVLHVTTRHENIGPAHVHIFGFQTYVNNRCILST